MQFIYITCILTSKTIKGNIFSVSAVLNTNSASWCTVNQLCISTGTGELIRNQVRVELDAENLMYRSYSPADYCR